MSEQSEFDSSLQGQRQQRLDKVRQLVSLGINPYPALGEKSVANRDISEKFEEFTGKDVAVVGRLISRREHGQLMFGDLQDDSGQIQLYIKAEELHPTNHEMQNIGWEHLNLIDVGDHLEAHGTVLKTESGQISVLVRELKMLSKAIRPIPSVFHGIKDKEERFRRRYLDMTVNPEVRERFHRRAKFWQATRDFMDKHGFVEVNIPVLEHVTGGADAKPFVTHYDALKQDFYLRISHELPLKKLLGGGFEKVYDLGPRFRNEGFSDEHLPEHIAMEWYWAYADYRQGMDFTKEMFRYIMQEVYGTQQFNMKGFDVDLSEEWEELQFVELIQEKFNVDVFETPVEEMGEILKQNGVDLGDELNRSRAIDNLWKLIRKTIAGPAFLVGVPKFLSPLSKTNKDDPRLTDRFHPIIAGSELANAFSELNDPVDQLDRFVEQQRMRDAGDDEAHMLDIDFVEMLEYGMPPAVGFGMSERVFWFFEDVSAKEGVPFPQLKHELDNTTLQIYEDIADLLPGTEGEHIPAAEKTEITDQDLDRKMVLVLREDLRGWQLTNTVAHLTALLGSKIGHQNLVTRPDFILQNDEAIKANAQYGIISMKAKSATQLANLLTKAEDAGLLTMSYVQEMIDFNLDVELQEQLGKQNKAELDFIGVGLFGTNEEIDRLTKKFSLWK